MAGRSRVPLGLSRRCRFFVRPAPGPSGQLARLSVLDAPAANEREVLLAPPLRWPGNQSCFRSGRTRQSPEDERGVGGKDVAVQ